MAELQIALIRRFGPWLLLVVLVAAYYPRFAKFLDGVQLYPAAASCLLHNEALQQCEAAFTYPPFFAFIMIPFAPMPMWLRYVVWYVITIGAVMGSFKISEMLSLRLVSGRLSVAELGWVRGLALLLSIKFVLAVLENQAYDAFVLVFILLGAAALSAGREAWGGSAIGVAAALKATPLVFLPYLLLKRRFVGAAAFVVVLLVASYLPDMVFTPQGGGHGYFNAWLRDVAGASLGNPSGVANAFWSGANPLNHSLHGAVSLLIDERNQQGLYKIVLYSVDLAFIAVVGVLLLMSPRQNRFVAIDASMLLIAMLMLSPMTSRSHYVLLLLPYTVLITVWMRDRATRVVGTVVLCASFVLATATSNDVAGPSLTDWAYGHSFLVLGALVLLVYIAMIIWNANRVPQFLSDAAWSGPTRCSAPEGTGKPAIPAMRRIADQT
jgi:hypothetical protein